MQFFQNILGFFINNAQAAIPTARTSETGGNFSLIAMTVIFVLFMYFVMWRPQSKRSKDHRDLVASLTKGDEVITAGGILGRIVKVHDSYATLALNDSTEVVIQKNSIANALPKGTLKSIL